MAVFSEIADSLQEAQTVAVFITKTPEGELRITIMDPYARGAGKMYLNGHPAMLDAFGMSLSRYGIDAAAAIINSAVNGQLSKAIPAEQKFEIKQDIKDNYYKHGAKNAQQKELLAIIDKGDALMRQHQYDEALLMYQSALPMKANKSRKRQLNDRLKKAEENIQFMKDNPNGFIKNPLPSPKSRKPRFPKLNPEKAIESTQIKFDLAPQQTVGNTVQKSDSGIQDIILH